MDGDVIIVGGGIVGCAAAYFLSRAGRRVLLVEAEEIAAGASGRNAGLIEHPYDAVQEALYTETVALSHEVTGVLATREPVGVLLLANSEAEARAAHAHYNTFSALRPEILDPAATQTAEPLLADDVWGCLLATGHPVTPREATERWADAARAEGARVVHRPARLLSEHGAARGVEVDGEAHTADAVVVAAGVASPGVVDPSGDWRPIAPRWGVSVTIEGLPRPRRPLIEAAVAATAQQGKPGDEVSAFTLIATPSALAVGSVFLRDEPDGEAWRDRVLAQGHRWVPALTDATAAATLVCARPATVDGRPLIGRIAGIRNLWIAAGHGGRGVSTGPASARMLADAVLAEDDTGIPPELRAERFPVG
ncbi:MAG: FAD-binding oxidoreductase [Solirubrobacteraceae bacterium]|nr:FAD-binding oxidoreductase [Solirubrobacteraceae bacterium]